MSKFISVIVPVCNVQGYVTECLDSALAARSGDAEVVAVDDASTDHGAEVLDERARADARLTVLRLPERLGPGPARNAGLDAAGGEYVWFVDGDDYLAPGALAVVEAHLRAEKPDVLLTGVARERWNRSVSRSWTPRAEAGVAALTRPLPPLGGVVVRRQLLLDHGIRFAAGWHEQVGFTAAVLAAAERVAVLEPVCYVWRADRDGSIGATRSAQHADLVAQWATVLMRPEVAGAAPATRRQIAERAVDEGLALLRGGRLPGGSRRAVFTALAGLLRRHEVTGGRHSLVATGSYPAYRLLRGTRDTLAARTGGLRRRVRTGRRLLRKALLRGYYHTQLLRPIDENLAVYAAYWYRGYACNPAAIFEKARELAPAVRGVWVVKSAGAVLPAGVEHVVAGTAAYYRAIARAHYLINNATFPPEVVKRRGAVHVQTHHGTPLKTMGLDQPRFPASLGNFDVNRMRRNIAKWDFSITANRHTTLLWDRQFPIPGETLETGYPRNDQLVRATAADVEAARAELGVAAGERVVLYAPTHREWHLNFTPVLDVDAFADALGDGVRVLLRGHYFYQGLGFPPQHPRVLDVSAHPSVERLMLAADVMITDFSSVMFDYAVLDKPLVVYAPDWEVYRAVRGVTFDLRREHPGTFATTFEELVEAFRSGAVEGPEAAAYRARFRERFCSLEDGHAAERVVRRVFLGEKLDG
jgi:CDP-glycerol glycerophosphotransferase